MADWPPPGNSAVARLRGTIHPRAKARGFLAHLVASVREQAGVSEEAPTDTWLSLNAAYASPGATCQAAQIIGRRIDQPQHVEMAPEEFEGIGVRAVRWQPFDGEPVAILFEERPHRAAPMAEQPIPDKQDRTAPMPLERAEEGEQVRDADRPASKGEEPPQASSGGVGSQRARRAECGPTEGLDDDRGVGSRRPGGPDGGTLGEPSLVLKDNPGLQACSVFKPGASGT